MKIAFTLCSNNYLAQAKTFAESFAHYNRDVKVIIGLVDKKDPAIDYSFFSPFEIISVEEIGINDFNSIVEKYNIIELNTAVKPSFFLHLLKKYSPEFIYYFDPDIMLFSSIESLNRELTQNNILLTPVLLNHSVDKLDNFEKGNYQLGFESSFPENFIYWELHGIRYGLYCLGFIGVANTEESIKFLKWWNYRTLNYGFINHNDSQFTDQLWVNFAPVFFEKVVISKDPGLNIAHWNLHERKLVKRNSVFFVNETHPLIFFHYSSYDPLRPNDLSRYDKHLGLKITDDIREVITIYQHELIKNKFEYFLKCKCLLPHKTHSAKKKEQSEPTTLYYKLKIKIKNRISNQINK